MNIKSVSEEEENDIIHPFKKVPLHEVEKAIAKAISALMGKDYECSLESPKFSLYDDLNARIELTHPTKP